MHQSPWEVAFYDQKWYMKFLTNMAQWTNAWETGNADMLSP